MIDAQIFPIGGAEQHTRRFPQEVDIHATIERYRQTVAQSSACLPWHDHREPGDQLKGAGVHRLHSCQFGDAASHRQRSDRFGAPQDQRIIETLFLAVVELILVVVVRTCQHQRYDGMTDDVPDGKMMAAHACRVRDADQRLEFLLLVEGQ